MNLIINVFVTGSTMCGIDLVVVMHQWVPVPRVVLKWLVLKFLEDLLRTVCHLRVRTVVGIGYLMAKMRNVCLLKPLKARCSVDVLVNKRWITNQCVDTWRYWKKILHGLEINLTVLWRHKPILETNAWHMPSRCHQLHVLLLVIQWEYRPVNGVHKSRVWLVILINQ